jgi:hypothetical protein
MPQRWLRVVGLLTLATFLAANGPVNTSALACLLSASRSCPETPGPGRCGDSRCNQEPLCDCDAGCACCRHEQECGEAGDDEGPSDCGTVEPAGTSAGVCQPCSRPSGPCGPFCPGCPAGCCWCCAANVPCCLDNGSTGPEVAPCLGAIQPDLSLAIPPAPSREVFQPPRA